MTETRQPRNNNVLIIAATVVVVVVIGAIALIAIAIDDGARATSMIGLVVGPVTSLFAFLVVIQRVEAMRSDVDQVKGHTEAMTNGLGDAKIRAGLADVLRPDLIDPEMRAQLVADRVRQAAALDAGEVILGRAIDPDNPTHRRNTP